MWIPTVRSELWEGQSAEDEIGHNRYSFDVEIPLSRSTCTCVTALGGLIRIWFLT